MTREVSARYFKMVSTRAEATKPEHIDMKKVKVTEPFNDMWLDWIKHWGETAKLLKQEFLDQNLPKTAEEFEYAYQWHLAHNKPEYEAMKARQKVE